LSELATIDWAAAVISPGWKPSHPVIADLRNREVTLLNEIDIAWEIKQEVAPSQKWLAVTGTNGKTSTVELTESILKASGISAFACGNVGTPVIDAVTSDTKYDYLVLELSSFQLHWTEAAEFVACGILNIAADHIDWHGSMTEYANAKLDLLSRSETAILNGRIVRVEKDDPRGSKYIVAGTAVNLQTPVGVVGRFSTSGRYLIITVYEITKFEG
jgi:UDP-N-acetylmuramoylalanine--D-glutamate ligase